MPVKRQGELFERFTGGRCPQMSRETRTEIECGCSSYSLRPPADSSAAARKNNRAVGRDAGPAQSRRTGTQSTTVSNEKEASAPR